MLNKVILIGNTGRDPEIRSLPSSTKVANFTLATNEIYNNDKGEKVKITEWHTIVAWRNLAEFCEKYIKKGMLLYVEGRIRSRSYTTQDGQNKTVVEILADKIQMLGKREEELTTTEKMQVAKAEEGQNTTISSTEEVIPINVNENIQIDNINDEISDLPF